MKRFVFRLASVLKVREFELERARIALSQIEQERLRREGVVRTASESLQAGREILSAEVEAGVDGERLAMRADGVTVGRIKWQQAKIELSDLEPGLVEARERVRGARARVRGLDRLREQRAESHRQKSLAVEQAELEELALVRFARDEARNAHAHGKSNEPTTERVQEIFPGGAREAGSLR